MEFWAANKPRIPPAPVLPMIGVNVRIVPADPGAPLPPGEPGTAPLPPCPPCPGAPPAAPRLTGPELASSASFRQIVELTIETRDVLLDEIPPPPPAPLK